MATDYEQGGAQAVSCLMDARYFGGGPEDFHRVRGATVLPLLYKEFVIDPWQVWQAKSLGASVVLLIVAALPSRELRDLLATVKEAGLMHLVEVHSEEELRKAADSGAECIGVNNRDLRTFEVSLETSFRLAAHAPDNCTLISESGIWTAEDVAQLHKHGFQGILVGEHLLKQTDIVQAVQDLMARVW
jgi:indole-3-glycerol phosphate synthase